MTAYRENILALVQPMLQDLECHSVLDFGCGDGWFATQFGARLWPGKITPLDVYKRPNCLVDPVIYSGDKIPFEDRQFSLAYAIDVLHHCVSPEASLLDLIRCTDRYLVIKDHTYSSPLGYAALCILDELGNRRFRIPSLYHYQRRWDWVKLIESNGMRRVALHPAVPVHTGVLGAMTNGLQFIGVWERT